MSRAARWVCTNNVAAEELRIIKKETAGLLLNGVDDILMADRQGCEVPSAFIASVFTDRVS